MPNLFYVIDKIWFFDDMVGETSTTSLHVCLVGTLLVYVSYSLLEDKQSSSVGV